jgi:beta-glucosidase
VETLLSEMTLEEKVYQLCAVYFGSGDEIFQDSGVITEKLVSDQLGDHNKKSETQRP